MATVKGKTSLKIDDLIDDTIISGAINGSNHLILTTRGGADIDAGLVGKPFGSQWNNAATYETGDVVGYAGQNWKAKAAVVANRPPAFFTSLWTPITGASEQVWSEKDSFFTGNTPGESWEFFWKIGNPVVSVTSVAGEFETGKQALKIVLAASEAQRFYSKEENIVRGGEVIQATVRCRLLASSATTKLEASLLCNDEAALPDPFGSGLAQAAAVEGQVAMTTSFADYKFTMTVPNGKARAKLNIIPSATAAGGSTICIDRVTVRRYPNIFAVDTDWLTMTLQNSWVPFEVGPPARIPMYRRKSGLVLIKGLMKNGTNNTNFWQAPVGFRCLATVAYEYAVLVLNNGGYSQILQNGTDGQLLTAQVTGNGPSYTYLAGAAAWPAEA